MLLNIMQILFISFVWNELFNSTRMHVLLPTRFIKIQIWRSVFFLNMVALFRSVFMLVCWQACVGGTAVLPECKNGEYHYEYTECGSDGGRWHVPLPHDASHCTITTKPAIRQKSCDSSCPQGQFSDVSFLSEKCKPCPKGTHSLGGVLHYNNWTVLPPEFDTYSVKSFNERMQSAKDAGCNSTWVADGNFLRTEGTSCVTRLTYAVDIVRDEGSITFWYYYTNENYNLDFEVFVKNEQCQIAKQPDNNDNDNGDNEEGDYDQENQEDFYSDMFSSPEASSSFKFQNFTLQLKRGKNLVVWEVEHWNWQEKSKLASTVFIRDIKVKGASSTSECVPCSAGSFASEEGSGWCELCPENFVSDAGAEKCTSCNEKTEYAPRGSSQCLKRPPCKKSDYMETSSSCDKNDKFNTVYEWIEPKICSDVIDGAVKLPDPGPKQICPPCNPGMYLNNTKCLFCPKGTFSDGVKRSCTRCLPFTAPVLNHDYHSWRSWPSSTDHWCLSYVNGCSTENGWQLRYHYVDSAFGHSDDVTMYFEVTTEGFAGERGLESRTASAVGKVRIDFELDCEGPCVFVMFERSQTHGLQQLSQWDGREPRQNYSYAVTTKGRLTYRWQFRKSVPSAYQSEGKSFNYINDRVKIYALYLSNTLDGGASECRECLVRVHQSGCVACPEGHYIKEITKKCEPCSKGTYLSKNKCVQCGPGLTSKEGSTRCYSDCHYHARDGRHLDFEALDGTHVVQTKKSFFSEGTAFIYEYHINLCGVDAPTPHCHSNITKFRDGRKGLEYLNASICQMRILPGKNNGPSVSTTLAGIGHQLMGIYEEKPENVSLDVFRDEKLLNESLIYFDYLSHSTTPSCPDGRSAWIILRCDPDETGKGRITFPPECHEGTCDGCQFLFLWHTQYACPLCTNDNYDEIESGCVNSKKQIHYSWKTTPKHCIEGVKLPPKKTLPCSDMSVHEAVKQFQILIGIVAFVITAIIATLFFLWYKNRVLKYKLYQRVSVNDSNQNDELPAAESCMADEDEEDGEKVEFRRGENPGKKLLKKLKDMHPDKDENIKLSDSFEVDLN